MPLLWHAGALQQSQQPMQGSLSVTCCESLKSNRTIRESKGVLLDASMVTWDSFSGTKPVNSAVVSPLYLCNAVQLRQDYFACSGGFQTVLNNIISELGFGSALFD